MIESKRKKIFLILAVAVVLISIVMTITNLQSDLQLRQFISSEFLPIILLGNGIFFISQISSIKLYETHAEIKYVFLNQKFEIPYNQISHEEKNSNVLLFTAKDHKVFAIRKFEFENYTQLKNMLCSKSSFASINIFSNAKKGLLSYLTAIIIVSVMYLIYNI